MGCIFASVMNKALISIGSNENKEINIVSCQLLLKEIFSKIIYSKTCITAPYGTNYKTDFINQLAVVSTDKTKDEVSSLLKSLEIKMGRTPDDKKKGKVIIDIDLITWNNDILKPEEMNRNYIKNIISELNTYL